MADGTQIIVDDVRVDQASGHISIRVHSVTTNGEKTWNGPVRGYGMDAAQFKHQFNHDIERVKQWVVSQHVGFHGAHESVVAELGKLTGQVIG
jgi:hypothetical protein